MRHGLTPQEIEANQNRNRIFLAVFFGLAIAVEATLGTMAVLKTKEIRGEEGHNGRTFAALDAELKVAMDEAAGKEKALVEYGVPIGWEMTVRSAVDTDVTRIHHVEELRRYLDAMVDLLERHGESDAAGVAALQLKSKYVKWSAGATAQNGLTLAKLLPHLRDLLRAYRADTGTHATAAADDNTKATKIIVDARAATEPRKADVPVKSKALAERSLALVQSEASHHVELGTARANLNTKKAEVRAGVEKFAQERAQITAQIAEIDARIKIEQYKAAEAAERRSADGEVLGGDPSQQIVLVDLTVRDRPFPGTLFRVYRVIRGGIRRDVGSIELFEIGEDFSKARILPLGAGKGYPQVEVGDQIYNEHYERNRPRRVAIVGEVTGAFSREDLSARLQGLGDIFHETPAADTELAVVCAVNPTDAVLERLRAQGIRMISEKYFYEYLGLTYTARGE